MSILHLKRRKERIAHKQHSRSRRWPPVLADSMSVRVSQEMDFPLAGIDGRAQVGTKEIAHRVRRLPDVGPDLDELLGSEESDSQFGGNNRNHDRPD